MTDTALPPPLVPADCDLTDFPFMPLQVERLRRSKAWLICKRSPALAFYMINLWTACWHDKPAGSLEDDDDVLADLAMCDPAKWPKLKADVLRGWVKCDDGRLYHPVVSEKVREAWNSKLDQRWRTECSRIKKHNDRHGMKLPRPTFDEWVEAGCPQGQRLPVPRDTAGTDTGQVGETHSKGQGEGQGEGQGQGDSSSAPNGADGAAAPATPKSKPTAERGTRLPTDWVLPRQWGVWAVTEGYGEPDIRDEAKKFRNYWVAKSGKDATKLDWEATWQNWMLGSKAPRNAPGEGRGEWHETRGGVEKMAAELGMPKWDECVPWSEYLGRVRQAESKRVEQPA